MPDTGAPVKRGRKNARADVAASHPLEEKIVRIPLTELHDFPNHPFKVRDDDAMQKTIENMKQTFCCIVPRRKPLTIWASKSCSPSRVCRGNTQSCSPKRKLRIPTARRRVMR